MFNDKLHDIYAFFLWNNCFSIQYAYMYMYIYIYIYICDFFVKLVCLRLHLSKSFISSALWQIVIEFDMKTSKCVLT